MSKSLHHLFPSHLVNDRQNSSITLYNTRGLVGGIDRIYDNCPIQCRLTSDPTSNHDGVILRNTFR